MVMCAVILQTMGGELEMLHGQDQGRLHAAKDVSLVKKKNNFCDLQTPFVWLLRAR